MAKGQKLNTNRSKSVATPTKQCTDGSASDASVCRPPVCRLKRLTDAAFWKDRLQELWRNICAKIIIVPYQVCKTNTKTLWRVTMAGRERGCHQRPDEFHMFSKNTEQQSLCIMRGSTKKITPALYTRSRSPGDVLPLPPPSSAGTCDSHRGRQAVSLRMSLEKHVGDNDGAQAKGMVGWGGAEKRRKRRSPRAYGGLLNSATAANSIMVHMCKHLRYVLV